MRCPGKPAPVLHPGVIYAGDNAVLICVHCAGMSARYTGRDISGHAVTPMPAITALEWYAETALPMACRCGRTVYLPPSSSCPTPSFTPPAR